MNSTSQHRREKLAGLFWPDNDESSARSKLRYALWQLRSAVGEQYFSADKIALSINPETEFWVDCVEFKNNPVNPPGTAQLEELVVLYQGEFLPGFYEDWIFLERDQLRAVYDQKAALLIDGLSGERRWRDVHEWAERWISLGQTPETAYQALMIAHNQLGDKASATSSFLRLELALEEDLGVEPSEIPKQIYESILQDEQLDVVSDLPTSPVLESTHLSRSFPAVAEYKQDAKPEAFVAREKELSWLNGKLQTALAEEGQLALVIGDAGQGKTALLKNFGQAAQEIHEELVIAYATCEAFSGMGEPYLPLRNVLALLCGDVAAKQSSGVINQENAQRLWDMIPLASQVLLEEGPDLLDSFVAGEALLRRANSYTLERPGWLADLEKEIILRKGRPLPVNIDHGDSRKELFDQYVRVILALSENHPLLIILDDMQWADPGSLSLIFHLARRIEAHPILILCSYRPADIALDQGPDQHPLAELLPEFRRMFGNLDINLNQSNRENQRKFVDDFLDTEPNNFDDDFRQALYLHTSGQPLFTIELLRQLQELNSIVKDKQGRWVAGDGLSWETMPAKVEAVIEGRINRLAPGLRELLNVASVEGEEFTGELIAAVVGQDDSNVINQLSREIARRHRLVEVSEVKRVGQQRLSIYRFRHNLFQKYVYDNLDLAEQSYLHEQVGAKLEQIYGEDTGLVAAQLARHYELSGLPEKAIDYLLTAGRNAKRLSANDQAVILLGKGIDLINQLSEGEQLAEIELAFQISLGTALVATQGYAAEQVERVFERARELSEQIGDVEQLAPALWGLNAFYQVRGKHRTAFQMAKQIEGIADKSDDPDLRLLAHWMLGFSHTHLGEFSAAKEHIEMALRLYDSSRDDSLTFLYGQNPKVTCLNYLAINLWILGYLDESVAKCNEAIAYAEQLSHPYSLTFAHGTAALFHAVRRDSNLALQHSEQAYKLAKKSGFPFFLALGMLIRGWARSQSGKGSMSVKLVENGIEAMRVIGTELGRPFFLSLMAEAKGIDSKEGLELLKSALEKADENQELWFKSAIYWEWGKIGEGNKIPTNEVSNLYKLAIDIATEQDARSFILRGAMALIKFDDQEEQVQMARDLLTKNYQWFDAGLDDDLLVEAEAIIKQAK
ncbi:MAG: AAA family ATPase [Anaerolineales bacterium]|nr:AAA family ATPase [Anaerolineales bacterium]